ncbi:MAG: L,D-transpeptidase family protein [Candidatus Omnitrophica bacterium]|nr:L,D-transpeptidase family protein [Candidatus Omnitrophota bacterium]
MKNRWIFIVAAVVLIAGIGFVAMKLHKGTSSPASEPAPLPVQKLLDEATQAETSGDSMKARTAYQQIVSEHPDYDKVEDIQTKLGQLNMSILFSKEQTPQTEMYQVQMGDSLGKLAKQYGTTKELIKRSNGLKSDVIRIGQNLRIWKASFAVFVSKSQNTLILKSGEDVMKIYHVSTGRDKKENNTPVGTFKVGSKIANPVWFKPGGQPVPPESPENELGSRWMGFDTDPHYGIHGTIHPEVIGSPATAGCVRMANPDVEELFDIIPMGTKITIQE